MNTKSPDNKPNGEKNMKTMLIPPDGLEIDAVVPQCLDNQYVSDEVFNEMIDRGVDYRDGKIAENREKDFKTEFNRSLIYSSQVIIQRAFFKNSDFLYKNYLTEDRANFIAFSKLVRNRAIIPFLFKESSLLDNLDFDISKVGDRATQAMLQEVGNDVTCVRLSVDDIENKSATDRMGTKFGAKITELRFMTEEQRNAIASELFAKPERLWDEGAWDAFIKALDNVARYAFEKQGDLTRENKQLSRSHVYKDNFTTENEDSVVNGQFRRPGKDNPFLFELKKYVDLVYNTNLPDSLKRYTFTPINMPSRMALQDMPRIGYSYDKVEDIVFNNDVLESIRRTFIAHSQQAMSLPLLRDLTVADVVEIRGLVEWIPFKESQTRILQEPLQFLERLEEFQQQFDQFQRALSVWYNKKYKQAQTVEKYCSFISLALSLAGKLIVIGSDLTPFRKAMVAFGTDRITDSIPSKVKGFAAKLMVGVYDLGMQRLDADRTYTIELMQTNTELIREDLEVFINKLKELSNKGIPGTSEQIADQGIE